MINFFDPSLLAPSVATVLAVVFFSLTLNSFKSQSWNVKRWLIIVMVLWIPWSGATVLMRVASSKKIALMYLQISFISLQIIYYGLFKFHSILVFKKTDQRYSSFAITIIIGFNMVSTFNSNMLNAIRTENGFYYTDSFSLLLQLTNVIAGFWSGFFAFRAIKELDLFSSFYTPDGKRRPFQIISAILLLTAVSALLVFWVFKDTSGAKPDVTLFIFFSWFVIGLLGYVYGVRPISRIMTPQRIWAFIMIDSNTGMPTYAKSFGKKPSDSDYVLFSAALTATNVAIKAQFNTQSELNLISLDDRAILLSKRDNLFFCLIIDHDSDQLEILLVEIVKKIISHQKYKSNNVSYIDDILIDLLEV